MEIDYTGVFYDALRNLEFQDEVFLIKELKCLQKNSFFMGPAFTTFGERVDSSGYDKVDKIRLKMYDPRVIPKGSVVVLQTNDNSVAHAGDITLKIYKRLGAVAFVTDGLVRDSVLIANNGIKCFCKGMTPVDALNRWALTKYNIPVEIQGVKIGPGQIIVGDSDGIIAIPKGTTTAVLEKAMEIFEKENIVRATVMSCSTTNLQKNLMQEYKKYGRW
ncbi:MAG TPA: RraA family protein [Candidatus Scalindua sp.]|nr:RraA family protein [Candidatus Scalindua sp.]